MSIYKPRKQIFISCVIHLTAFLTKASSDCGNNPVFNFNVSFNFTIFRIDDGAVLDDPFFRFHNISPLRTLKLTAIHC